MGAAKRCAMAWDFKPCQNEAVKGVFCAACRAKWDEINAYYANPPAIGADYSRRVRAWHRS